MTKKRTDGGHEIPEEDLREMEQEEGREMPDGVESRITELFGSTAERPIDQDVVTVMLNVVDAIEAKHMKGITIDVGQGVKAKVSKMAKESIKVERSETSKKIYEE